MINKSICGKRSHGQPSCKKGAKILSYMIHQSRVVMQKIDSRKDRVSLYRFCRNEQVTGKGLTEIAVSHCIEQCREDHLLLIEDTSEFSLECHRGRITDRSGLGLTGNNRDPGFFRHPAVAVNAYDGSLPGALDIHFLYAAIGGAGFCYPQQP